MALALSHSLRPFANRPRPFATSKVLYPNFLWIDKGFGFGIKLRRKGLSSLLVLA